MIQNPPFAKRYSGFGDFCRDTYVHFRGITLIEIFFLALSAIMGIGFIRYSVEFAKIGIPLSLPSSFGGIRNQSTSLYVTEMYILAIAALFLFSGSARSKLIQAVKGDARRKKLLILVAVLVVGGLLRLSVDVLENPVLGIRNSAFVWYLCIPVLVALLPVRVEALEYYFGFIILIVFAYFVYSLLYMLINNVYVSDWLPIVGLYGPFALALAARSSLFAAGILPTLALGLGSNYWLKFQRTSLVGLCLTILIVAFFFRPSWRQFISRLAFLAVGILMGAAVTRGFHEGPKTYATANPFLKAGGSESGIEPFRMDMWKDALGLFAESPLVGVGFQRQVVYRIFGGRSGQYAPNDSSSWGRPEDPPISGPHNSYLNSLARLGILGGLLAVVHLLAMRILLRKRYYAGFFIVFAQAVYACFNVGLEGPTRSFFMLLAIGLALKLELQPEGLEDKTSV